MKAWFTFVKDCDGGCLVYAQTEAKARVIGWNVADGYSMAGEFIDMRARRMKKWDHPDPPHFAAETNADLHPDLDPFYEEFW